MPVPLAIDDGASSAYVHDTTRATHARTRRDFALPSVLERIDVASPAAPRYGRAGRGLLAMSAAGEETTFGFRQIPLAGKQALVDDVFRSVARRYDLMNDLMSGGLHRLWKDALVTAVDPPKSARPFMLLDLAGGTGDIAFRVVAAGGAGTRATVIDINPEMLELGRTRALERGLDEAIAFTEGNAETLPFPERSYDAVTIAFGIRNVPRMEAALAEARRVLRIGGRFLCLEFSCVDVPGLDVLYDFYSFNVIPALGRTVADDAAAYRYLVESIRRFPRPEAFADTMRMAGFQRVAFQRMTGGIVALHSGWRL
jgi:demethylmenaquinone methyltransferase/2-methoxy-6-polyprenyl-1,4-benzoquinol methylase